MIGEKIAITLIWPCAGDLSVTAWFRQLILLTRWRHDP